MADDLDARPGAAHCAPQGCRCGSLRARDDFADWQEWERFVGALAREPALLPAPPPPGACGVGLSERRLRCADCGTAWRLAAPDPPFWGVWLREPAGAFDALAADLGALERVLRREDGRSVLPGVRELRRLVESLAQERRDARDPEARAALADAGAILSGMLSHKAGLADFHVWRDDVEARRRENDALRILLERLQRRCAEGSAPEPRNEDTR